MSYDVIEASVYLGQPAEFYEFSRGSKFWRYTSGEEVINFSGSIYNPISIKRSKISESQDIGKSNITIETSRTNDFVQSYISSPPSDVINLTIRRYHITDPNLVASDSPAPSDVVVTWIGRVLNVSFKGDKCSVRCEPIYSSLKRSALRRMYQTSCPHALYGSSCLVNRAAFITVATASIVAGATIQSSSFALNPDGYFTGGFIEVAVGGVIERRFIISHIGSTLTINNPIQLLVSGLVVNAFPGCDRTLSTCSSKFSNSDNYGGFPYIPVKNPFTGTSVF